MHLDSSSLQHTLGAAELAYYCKFAYLRVDEHKRLEAYLTALEH